MISLPLILLLLNSNLIISKILQNSPSTPPQLSIPTQHAKPYITEETSKFGSNIEGASVNWKGEIFATSFGSDNSLSNSIGRVSQPQQILFRDDSITSFFNGIRFTNKFEAFVADVNNHRVLKLNFNKDGDSVDSTESFCSSANMTQPNDIAIGANGVVFTSGSKFSATTSAESGDIWVCEPGKAAKRLLVLGMTNGIEVNNDNTKLYISEGYYNNSVSVVQKIWKFKINPQDYSLSNRELFYDFDSDLKKNSKISDIDGMRSDIKGNLYVTRNGDGEVIVLNPKGEITKKILLNFSNPTNLEFGGEDGKSLFVIGRCGINTPHGTGKGCVDKIDVKFPGKAFNNIQATLNNN